MGKVIGILIVIALAQLAAVGVATWSVIEQRDWRASEEARRTAMAEAQEQARSDAAAEERRRGNEACVVAKARASHSVLENTVSRTSRTLPDGTTIQTGICKYRINLDGTFDTTVEVLNVNRWGDARFRYDAAYTGSVICNVGVDLELDQTTMVVASCYRSSR